MPECTHLLERRLMCLMVALTVLVGLPAYLAWHHAATKAAVREPSRITRQILDRDAYRYIRDKHALYIEMYDLEQWVYNVRTSQNLLAISHMHELLAQHADKCSFYLSGWTTYEVHTHDRYVPCGTPLLSQLSLGINYAACGKHCVAKLSKEQFFMIRDTVRLVHPNELDALSPRNGTATHVHPQ